MDCISLDGEAWIAYAATVRWRSFHIHYASILNRAGNQRYESSTSLREGSMPSVQSDEIAWNSDALNVRAVWRRRCPGAEKTLHSVPEGKILWSCIMPGADADIRHEGRVLSGSGYIERLEMTIPPWQLPIKELHWGRFVTETDSIVWIDWRGSAPLRLALHNGVDIRCESISDTAVLTDAGVLHLDKSVMLRGGPLISSVFSKTPVIRSVFPRSILGTEEYKWLSKATMKHGDRSLVNGFSIHEIVRFP